MDKAYFEKEMINYLHEAYSEFKYYQDVTNDVLKMFHALCRKANIKYCVAFGSLLGLIRDKGNIPWDYDIDVVVPIDYREKLISALESNLDGEYYYVYDNNLSHYPTSCLRVCKKGFTYMALHVDVFFLLGCPEDIHAQKKFMDQLCWLYYARQSHYLSYHIDNRSENKIRAIIRRLKSWIEYPIPMCLLRRIENHLYFKYPFKEAKYCTIFYPLRQTYSTSAFIKHETIIIENNEYCIPKEYNNFLTQRYGDYNKYPPIKDRFNEFYNMYSLISSRQEYYLHYLRNKAEK